MGTFTMNSIDVRTLKQELHRFDPKPCRSCQFILGFGVLVFLLSLTLLLFASQGVRPSSVIPVESIPRDKPLSQREEAMILDNLRALSQTHKNALPTPHADDHTGHQHADGAISIEP